MNLQSWWGVPHSGYQSTTRLIYQLWTNAGEPLVPLVTKCTTCNLMDPLVLIKAGIHVRTAQVMQTFCTLRSAP